MAKRRLPVAVVTCIALLASCISTTWSTSSELAEPFHVRVALGSNAAVRACIERCPQDDGTACASHCGPVTVEGGSCAVDAGSSEACFDGVRARLQPSVEGRRCAAIRQVAGPNLVWCHEDAAYQLNALGLLGVFFVAAVVGAVEAVLKAN